jgi:hypothetical protein
LNADPKTISPASEPDQGPEPTPHRPGVPSQLRAAGGSWRIWLIRIRALLFVTLCATFGVLLLILPCTDKWTDNSLLISFPGLRDIISSGFVRGTASGLGILDLWLGFWEAIHYHETSG